MKPDHERVTKLLTDTVTLLCKNGLAYNHELRIQGLLGITVDGNEVFLVSINDSFQCSNSSPSVTCSSTTDGGDSRKRSNDNFVDLTRLAETPDVRSHVQQSPQASNISPMDQNVSARPRSAGSITRTRTTTPNLSSWNNNAQPAARQLACSTAVGPGPLRHEAVPVTTCSAVTELMMMSNNRQISSTAVVDPHAVRPVQRPQVGYTDNIQHLMMACDRRLAARPPHEQQYRQLTAPAPSVWTVTDHQRALQHRQMQQFMARVGSMSRSSSTDSAPAQRAGVEHHFATVPPPPQCRQSGVPIMPTNPGVRRANASSVLNETTSAAVHGVSGSQMSMMSRQASAELLRLAYPARYSDNVPHVPLTAQLNQLSDSVTYFQPPAKRHAPNHSTGHSVLSHNVPHVTTRLQGQLQLPQSEPYCQYDSPMPVLQQINSAPNQQISQHLSHTSGSETAAVLSVSPTIKQPPSPVQSDRRSRTRTVEHIDLCADDEDAGCEYHIPVSSIVIQPDNIDSPTASSDPERHHPEQTNVLSANTSNSCAAKSTDSIANSLPLLTHVHEIMPVDDGINGNINEMSRQQSTVETDRIQEQSASTSFSDAPELLFNQAESDILGDLSPARDLDTGKDLPSAFSPDHLGADEMARVTADESRQMTELYFDAEDSDMQHI